MAIFRWALTRALSDPQSWPFYALVPANLYQNQFICHNRETNKQTGLKDKGKCVTNSALQSRKWQLIGMSQWCRSALCGHPLPALMDNWTHSAASRHTIAPTSHTWPSPRSRSYYSFPVPLRVEGWVGLSTQWVSNLLKVACSGPGVSRTRNLSVTSQILYHYTTAPTLNHCTHKTRTWCFRLPLWHGGGIKNREHTYTQSYSDWLQSFSSVYKG